MKKFVVLAAALSLVALAAPASAQSDLARAYRVIAGKKFVDLVADDVGNTVWRVTGSAQTSAR